MRERSSVDVARSCFLSICGRTGSSIPECEEVPTVLGVEASDTERKVVTILKVLSESSEPLGSIHIARELENHGIHLSERAVRYHLKLTDIRGFTRPLGRDGRAITPEGREEWRVALATDQVGFVI